MGIIHANAFDLGLLLDCFIKLDMPIQRSAVKIEVSQSYNLQTRWEIPVTNISNSKCAVDFLSLFFSLGVCKFLIPLAS